MLQMAPAWGERAAQWESVGSSVVIVGPVLSPHRHLCLSFKFSHNEGLLGWLFSFFLFLFWSAFSLIWSFPTCSPMPAAGAWVKSLALWRKIIRTIVLNAGIAWGAFENTEPGAHSRLIKSDFWGLSQDLEGSKVPWDSVVQPGSGATSLEVSEEKGKKLGNWDPPRRAAQAWVSRQVKWYIPS